jgi:hypothetical protein
MERVRFTATKECPPKTASECSPAFSWSIFLSFPWRKRAVFTIPRCVKISLSACSLSLEVVAERKNREPHWFHTNTSS